MTNAAQPSHGRRLFGEHAGQMLFTLTGFLDRLLLTAMLYRLWGTQAFEGWAALLAFAGLASLFEFGFNLYFSNSIAFKTERGEHAGARRVLAIANTVLMASAVVGAVVMAVAAFLVAPNFVTGNPDAWWALLILVAGNLSRVMVCAVLALYRANRRYGRLTLVLSLSEMGRIGLIALVVLAGGDVLIAAIVTAASQIVLLAGVAIFDTRCQFSHPVLIFAWPNMAEIREAAALSTAFFIQLVPFNLMLTVPVLALESSAGAVGAVAAFVLVRTLANVARTPLFSASIVVGQEVGRLVAVDDQAAAFDNVAKAGRAMSVVSGLLVGGLLAGGHGILHLWTGDAALYSNAMMIVALLPMLLAPLSPLAHNVLVSSQAPYLAATARWLQLGLSVASYFLLPIADPGIRMLAALAIGEVFGYLPVAYYAMFRLVRRASFMFHIQSMAWTLFGGGFAFGATWLADLTLPWQGPLSIVPVLLFASVPCAVFLTLAGFSSHDRRRVVQAIGRRGQNV